jgi:hypothetical protein
MVPPAPSNPSLPFRPLEPLLPEKFEMKSAISWEKFQLLGA